MTPANRPTHAIDPYIFSDLSEISLAAETLKRRFAALGAPAEIQKSQFKDYEHLEIESDPDWLVITVKHFGTQINFRCLITLTADNEPAARIICTLDRRYEGSDKPHVLGTFGFAANGITDLPGNERGEPSTLPADADRILGYFLHKAHRANASLYVQELAASTK